MCYLSYQFKMIFKTQVLLDVLQTTSGHTKSMLCPKSIFFITLSSTCICYVFEGRRSWLMVTRTTRGVPILEEVFPGSSISTSTEIMKGFLSTSSVWCLLELMLQSIQHFCPDLEAAVSSLDEDWKVLHVTFSDVAAKNNAGGRQGDQNDLWFWAPHSLASSLD